MARALPRAPDDRCELLEGHVDDQRLLGQGRGGGHGDDRRRHGLDPHGLDRPAGRLGDGPRRKRRLRRDDDQLLLGLARLLRGLPDRPCRLAARVFAAEPRPADDALVLGLALVLQPREHLRGDAAHLPGFRLAARPLALDRPHRTCPSRFERLAGVGARRRDGLPARISRNPQCRALERDRRRAFRRDRCAADRHGAGALRKLPDRGHEAPVRAARFLGRDPQPHPDERPLRGRRCAGRHVRPGLVRGLPAGLPRVRLERRLGLAPGGTRNLHPLGLVVSRRALARRPALRRVDACGDARLCVGGLAVLAVRVELEHERHDPAGAPDLRLLLPELAGASRRVRDARRPREVLAARPASALVRLSRFA